MTATAETDITHSVDYGTDSEDDELGSNLSLAITLCVTLNLVRDGVHIVEFIIVLKVSCNVLFLNVVEKCVSYV